MLPHPASSASKNPPAWAAIDAPEQDILHAGWGQMGVLIAYQIGLLGRRRVGGILEEMQPIPAVFQLVIQLIADPACPTVERKKKKIRVNSISTAEVNSCRSSVGKSGCLGEITKGQTRINNPQQTMRDPKPWNPKCYLCILFLGCEKKIHKMHIDYNDSTREAMIPDCWKCMICSWKIF